MHERIYKQTGVIGTVVVWVVLPSQEKDVQSCSELKFLYLHLGSAYRQISFIQQTRILGIKMPDEGGMMVE